ncbi:FkbM family methyltransferase [Xanthomonas arboricola]|uniref:FkbM family methyltransferase n=1 Tax=Xanthomonas arboricola pv. guizotiae TaxID=487867 RepID=A0A2S6ZYJ1_9XANT|nr:FkbM family methyltransferase [Xanthomonas arboricola]PPT97878.1 FkbM family methyltransferase [Xanthomonas arboricola pv. guizotiae]PPU21084.1 FkbM family methyltransferase [Xanthomonas arboricola pv. guizotiae]
MSLDEHLRITTNPNGDERVLRECLARYADAFAGEPDFCVPPQARRLLDQEGATLQVVLLGSKLFGSVFVREAAARVEIIGVVDDYKVGSGQTFHGIPFISSATLIQWANSRPIVCVNTCRFDYSRRYFKHLALTHRIPLLNYEQAIRWLGITACLDHRVEDWGGYIVRNLPRFDALAARLGDPYSRFTLFSVLLAHLSCDPEWILHAAKPYSSLYFRSGLFAPGLNECFADCGASIAESSRAFLDSVDESFEKIWMIEPDHFNGETLKEFIRGRGLQPAREGQIELIACALGEADGELPFLHEGGHGGQLLPMPSGQSHCHNVAVRRLDDLLDRTPTLIKMDIEGAELAALRGASAHIVAGRPTLAISAYHRSSDLLELVDAVENMRDDYRIGLRHNTEDRWDTCLYFY